MIRLVAFDLDGTLVRGPGLNCGDLIAETLGHPEWTEQMEPLHMRGETPEQMSERVAPWLDYSKDELCRPLRGAQLAPGAARSFRLLRERGVATAVVSLAFDFVVEWFAERLGAEYWAASRFDSGGGVVPLWPEDKGPWLRKMAMKLELDRSEIAAVGDSIRDASLLAAAGHAFYVGNELPNELAGAAHYPEGNLAEIAGVMLAI